MKSWPFVVATLALLEACQEPEPKRAAAEPTSWPVQSAADAYFPLVAQRLYEYRTDDRGETGMLVANAARTDATHGSLRVGDATQRFVYDPRGVARDGGAYLLKLPLAVGTAWSGEHGGETRITQVDLSVTVLAGSYGSCVETTEDVVPEAHYRSTYCPGVGLVSLEVDTPRGKARVELRYYGAPQKI